MSERVDDFAVLEHHDPVGERDGFIDVVGHEQHAEAVLAPEVEQQRPHTQPGQGVQRTERLIEQQQPRARPPAPAPTKRVAPDRRTSVSGHTSARSVSPTSASARSARACACCLGQPTAGEAVDDVGAHIAPREQPRFLECQRGRPDDLTMAGVVGRQPGQYPQHRRLAGAASPDQRDDLTPVHLHRDVVEDMVIAVPLVDVSQFTCDVCRARCRQCHVRYLNARRSSARTMASVPIPSSA